MNAGGSTARDWQRAKVYAAEEFVRTLFDRAAEHGSRSVEFFGAQLTLPPEARFGSVPAVQRYVIAVPDLATANWAMRELVVLHELAHHLCDASPPHGSQYVATLCTLAELVMGPELGHVLRVVYAKEGVR